MTTWIISVGPNQGRGSSHAHGPVTSTGPRRVVTVESVVALLERYYNRSEEEVEQAIRFVEQHDG
jgi:hypothetical protein